MRAVNTVALLFLTEVDNVAYALGISERVRALVEVDGRVELSESDIVWLTRSKVAHMIAITMGIGLGPKCRLDGGFPDSTHFMICLYWLAGLVSAIGSSPTETAKRMATATVAMVTGCAFHYSAMLYAVT